MKSDVRVVRVDHADPVPEKEEPPTKKKSKPHHSKKPKFGILKHGKTARNKPRFEGVADPAKAPPSRKQSKTLKILTDKGIATRRRKITDESRKVPIHKIRQTLRNHGLPVKENTPEKLARKIYEDAQEAGMIS
jgi:hypothetical protein